MNTGLRTDPSTTQGPARGPVAEPGQAIERAVERVGARLQALTVPSRPGDEAGTLRLAVGRAELVVRADGPAPAAGARVEARVLKAAKLPLVQVLGPGSEGVLPGTASGPRTSQVVARFPDAALLIDGGRGAAPARVALGSSRPAIGSSTLLAVLEVGAPAQVELQPVPSAGLPGADPAAGPAALAAGVPLPGSAANDAGRLLLQLAAGLRGRLASAGAGGSAQTPEQLVQLLARLRTASALPAGGAELLARLLPSLALASDGPYAQRRKPLAAALKRGAASLRALVESGTDELATAARSQVEAQAAESRTNAARADQGEPQIVHLPLPHAEQPAWFALQPQAVARSGGLQRMAFGVEFTHTGPVRVDALGLDGRFSLTLRFAEQHALEAAERAAGELRELLEATGRVQRLNFLLDPAGARSSPGLELAPERPAPPSLDRVA